MNLLNKHSMRSASLSTLRRSAIRSCGWSLKASYMAIVDDNPTPQCRWRGTAVHGRLSKKVRFGLNSHLYSSLCGPMTCCCLVLSIGRGRLRKAAIRLLWYGCRVPALAFGPQTRRSIRKKISTILPRLSAQYRQRETGNLARSLGRHPPSSGLQG